MTIEIMEFTYVTEKKTSKRVFIPLTKPAVNYFGIDITEISGDDEEVTKLLDELLAIEEERSAKLALVMAKHDVKQNFRNFISEKMQDITTESY